MNFFSAREQVEGTAQSSEIASEYLLGFTTLVAMSIRAVAK